MSRCVAGTLLWLLTLLGSTAAGALNNPDTWGDWLIVEESAPVDANGSILLRRITPKSVFVAPSFECSEGYSKDSLGRCVKLVKVNPQAQWNFLLQKLNSMYASPQSAKTETKEESEPFRISIPIGSVGNKTNTETSQSSTLFPITASFGGSEAHLVHDSPATTVKLDSETTTKFDETTTMKLSETTIMKDDSNNTLLSDNVNKTILSLNQRDSESETHPPRNDQGVREASKIENKKFLIVVSSDEPVQTTVAPVSPFNEETTGLPTTTSLSKDEELTSTGTEDYYFSESVSTMDSTVMTTTGETATNPSRFDSDLTTTTLPTRTSDYDDDYYDSSGSDKSDEPVITEQESLKVKLPVNVRSKCDQSVQVSQLKNGQIVGDSSTINCETVVDDEQQIKTLLTSPSNQPVLEPSSQIRFPSESNLPVRKTNNYVKFPETPVSHYSSKLWDSSQSRQPYWWPSSWEYSQHPGIRGWPPMGSSHQSPQSQQPLSGSSSFHKQYHQYNSYPTYHQQTHSWSSPTATWHRRIFQRE